MFGPADKKLGFGFMRLPMKGEEVDIETTCRMVDEFLAAGFCYFDTAHGYHDGQSEAALKAALTSRYPREKYILADKLSPPFFEKEADIRPLLEQQLEACGVEYFDMYLMHAQSSGRFEFYKSCRAYETAFALKAEGRVRHVGISFHDTATVLERILTEYPQLDFVQLQFNYLDYEDPQVQSRACYEVCRRHQKPVVVMEPVRGGRLAQLPDEARALLAKVSDSSPAGFALRFAADFEGVKMVLSGMSSLDQMEENLRVMSAPAPLT
uniref:aldo/keto reductase n=1 Tax=Candidatus Allofournierella excrementavium TaxID=2838591 RepID=UPI003A8C641B